MKKHEITRRDFVDGILLAAVLGSSPVRAFASHLNFPATAGALAGQQIGRISFGAQDVESSPANSAIGATEDERRSARCRDSVGRAILPAAGFPAGATR